MHVPSSRYIVVTLLLVGALCAGWCGDMGVAHAQAGPLARLAVVEGREAVFVRSGPSIFYPIAGYLTTGSLIAVDGRSSVGDDAWLRTWRDHHEVWVPAWRVTLLGDADDLPVVFRLVTPPYPIRLQAEGMRGDGTLRLRRRASDDLTVRLRPGDARSAVIAAGGLYRAEVYFLNRGTGVQSIEVSVDGQVVSRVMVQVGSTPGYNTIVGYDGDAFVVPRGLHVVQVRITGGNPAGIEIDEVTLRPVAQRFPSTQPVG
ncbi:hypothetical protein [Aggregatilinea lenta]|uniref:hypothetical protein n=1 Tax=Aggregatilinea lenta TaxID=913108 RepID=UPI000E5AF176|nr:hypothetical protein [Aggregatilinea lenta]